MYKAYSIRFLLYLCLLFILSLTHSQFFAEEQSTLGEFLFYYGFGGFLIGGSFVVSYFIGQQEDLDARQYLSELNQPNKQKNGGGAVVPHCLPLALSSACILSLSYYLTM